MFAHCSIIYERDPCGGMIVARSRLHSLARIGQFSMSDHLISTSTNNRANNIASFVEYRRS